MRLIWRPQAAADLESISLYLSLNAAPLRQPTVRSLFQGIESLRHFPYRGRIGAVSGTREIVFPRLPYIATYLIEKDTVIMLNIWHTSQDGDPRYTG